MEENLKIPAHVALILDGNGRWAKKRGLPRQMGHKNCCETVEQIVEDAARLGIRYLTVYGFSTENWKRPEEEVGALMQLFRYYTKRLLKIATESNVRVKMIGERSRFAADIIEGINQLEEQTKENTGLTFIIAVNYGGRDEITRAVRKVMADCRDGKLTEADMNETVFASYLDTANIPDPDLQIPVHRCGKRRYPGSGSVDPYKRRVTPFQLFIVAACLFRIICYRLPVAGFQQRRTVGGNPSLQSQRPSFWRCKNGNKIRR